MTSKLWRILISSALVFILPAGSTLQADEPLTKGELFNLIADADHRYTGSGPWPVLVPPRWFDDVRLQSLYVDKENPDRSELDAHTAGLVEQINSSSIETLPRIGLLGDQGEANVILLVGTDLDSGLREVLHRQPKKGWVKLAKAARALSPATCIHLSADTPQGRIVAGLIFISTRVPIEVQEQCASGAFLHIIGLKGISEPNMSLKNCFAHCLKLRPLDIEALKILYVRPEQSGDYLGERIEKALQN